MNKQPTMYHFNQEDLSIQQQYKFITGSVIPRPIAWITTYDQTQSVLNIAPFSFFNVVSKEEPLVSVSILRDKGKMKDTARNLLETKEAVIHIVSEKNMEAMNATAKNLPSEESELSLTSLTTVPSKSVKVPGIQEADIRFEGVCHTHLPIQNKNKTEVMSDLFIIEITDFYFNKDVFDITKEYILAEKLKPVARLAGNNYAHIGKTYMKERPN